MFNLNNITHLIDTHPIGRIFQLGQKNAVWKRVEDLNAGMKIAVAKDNNHGVYFEEIVSIKKVGRERVYDIEVEGTHNFVGNGIIAHNTIITGDVGIGTTAPTTALHLGTNAETHALSTGDALISSDLELDGILYLDGGTIANSAGTASLILSSAPTTTANSLSASNWLIENTANLGQAALMVNQTKAGDLFTASASGTTKFIVSNGGNVSAAGVYQGTSGTNTRLQATGTGTGSTGTGSIYFLNSSGTTKGRFDTTTTASATGGTITTDGSYTVHTFTSSGTFTPPSSGDVEYLVVGGGGGGGRDSYGSRGAGGGGAGGFRTASGFAVSAQGYTITVGAGGNGATSVVGTSGGDSTFSTITSTGGGYGGGSNGAGAVTAGSNGGSGGGAAHTPGSYGTGTGGQGNNGGNGVDSNGYLGGGGGGSSAVGGNATAGVSSGNGGAGTASSISGASVTYAGGGGGAGSGTQGTGGSGGGGNGSASTAGNGTANTGSGGGAGELVNGGAGGSGIVIIRYLTAGTFTGYGTLYLGSTNTSSSDLAEYYVAGDSSIAAGDVVVISNTRVIASDSEAISTNDEIATSSSTPRNDKEVDTKGVLMKADKAYDSKLIGIISTNPGVLMGSIDGDTGAADKRMLALSGRVPVKIDPDSEPIEVGDFLTSSDKPGLAIKATKAGYTVGKALESWNSCVIASDSEAISDGIATSSETPPRNDNCPSTIEVFVNLGYSDPDLSLTDSGNLNIDINSDPIAGKENQYQLTNGQVLINRIGAYAQLVSANIRAGLIESKVIKTELISPVADADLIIDLSASESARLVIKGKDDKEVASIDATGKVISNELQVMSDATVSGTLYADKIESTRLSEIEELLREVETNQLLLAEASTWDINTATESATFSELITNDLFVTGNASITSLFISDNLTTKNINSLTEPLSIQSLASSPLEIMAGKIIVDTNGNTKFLGNVEIAGDLKINNIIVANNIDPTATESASIIEGEINSNATAGTATLPAGLAELKIKNEKLKINSLVYITPVTSTQNKVLYVKSKDPSAGSGQVGQFTIGFNEAIDTDVEFNWWIIELEPILDVTN